MVVHWETSLKSLYVRTVWIDGRRHAILSKDDPVASSLCPIVTSMSRSSRGSSPESLSVSSTSSQSNNDLTLSANPLNLTNIKSNNNYKYEHNKIEKNYNVIKNSEVTVVSNEKNSLSERVMQWLDLAGRDNLNLGIDNLECDELKNYESVTRRNSADDECNAKVNKPKKHTRKVNKRYNKFNRINISDDECEDTYNTYTFSVPYVSNDILNYAKKTFINSEVKIDTPNTVRTSIPSNLITFNSVVSTIKNKTESANIKSIKLRRDERRPQTTNFITTRQKSNQDDNESQPIKKTTLSGKCFESQYLELVRKRINENTYNMKAARRQLHIFIPSLPKQTICDSTASSILTIDE